MKSTSLTYADIAALAPSAPTVERIAMVADEIDRDDAVTARGEYVALRAPEDAPPATDNDYPRNRAERRAAARAIRGAPARRR